MHALAETAVGDRPKAITPTISVVLAVNMNLMRCALARLLDAEADLSVLAALGCDSALADAVWRLRPDVVVVDVDDPLPQSVAAVEELHRRAPGIPVVALAPTRPPIVRRLLTIPVTSAIDRTKPPARLLEAIRAAAGGDQVVDVSLAVAALAVKPNPLTAQETEVLRRAAGGATGPEIAAQMHLSQGTVRNYLSKAALKTSARGRVDAVRIAQEAGWL
jgi:two-component system, NarL family, response regulator DesR